MDTSLLKEERRTIRLNKKHYEASGFASLSIGNAGVLSSVMIDSVDVSTELN